ncbi:hypothetical protein ACTL6U_02610 [Rhodovibrionaceae bacterium A322]
MLSKPVVLVLATLALSGCASKIESRIWGFEPDPFPLVVKSYVPEVTTEKLPLTLKVDINATNTFTLAHLPSWDPNKRVPGFYCGQVYSVYFNMKRAFEKDMLALLEQHFEKVEPLPKDISVYSGKVAEGEVYMTVEPLSGLTGISSLQTTERWGEGDLFAKTIIIGKVTIGAVYARKPGDWVRFSEKGLRYEWKKSGKLTEPEDRNGVTMKAFYQEACKEVPKRLPDLMQGAYEAAMRNFSAKLVQFSNKLRKDQHS